MPVAKATDQALRASATRALAALDPASAFLMGKLLGPGGVRMERSIRLLCTKVWPVLYQVLTMQGQDDAPIDIWCLPKEEAIRRLPSGTPLRKEIEAFHQAVWTYYPAEARWSMCYRSSSMGSLFCKLPARGGTGSSWR